jgi:hypothetical protein
MSPIRFAGYMHPRHYVPLPSRAARSRGRASTAASVALAVLIGAVLCAVLFIGLSGGFRP